MGGNTFGVEARRLDSTQHAALFKFVQTQLDPFTPYGLRTTRSPGDKKAHGDLDVMIGSLATGPGFKYQFAGEASEYANLPSTDNNKWSAMSSTAEHPWTERELQEWMRDVARALGAVVWQKHRLGGIFAVPCHVIGHLATEAGPNECYQVDLNIVLPPRLGFGEFILSYGITPLFLNQVVKQLSPSFKIHHEHLVIHHSVYPGEPVISVELTGCAAKFLEWLGLDYEVWNKGFDTQATYQQWLAGISAPDGVCEIKEEMKGSRVVLGWTRLVDQTTPIHDTAGHQKERIQKLEDFRIWLRGFGYSSYIRPIEVGILHSPQIPSTPAATQRRITIRTDITIDINTQTGEATQVGLSSTTIRRDACANNSNIETSIDPRPLDVYAVEALRYFGKTEDYERILAERKVEWGIKVENKKRKEQNRRFALVNDTKAAREIKKAEGRWT